MTEEKTPGIVHMICKICAALSDQEFAYQKFGWEENTTCLPGAANQLIIIKDFQLFSSH